MRTVPWDDPTAGLADGSSDVAVVWAPVPGRVRTLALAREPVAVALPPGHALAGRTSVAFAALVDEPFLALPAPAGPLRAGWLADRHRGGGPPGSARRSARWRRPTRPCSTVAGVVLLAAGNADALTRDGVAVIEVETSRPPRSSLAWRADDRRPAVRAYVEACREVLAARG